MIPILYVKMAVRDQFILFVKDPGFAGYLDDGITLVPGTSSLLQVWYITMAIKRYKKEGMP